MEPLLVLFALFLLAAVVAGPVLALVALVRTLRLQDEVRALRSTTTPSAAAPAAPPPAAPATIAGPLAPLTAAPAPPPPPIPRAAPPPSPRAAGPPPPRAAQPPRPSPPRPPAAPADFATTLGPKIFVAAGALLVVAALGFFVKYAWESNWVGPTGRILFGATLSLGLVAGGVRLVPGEYRPLGQGLAAAGIAGLYVSAFGAYGFYDLVPREWAGVLMVAITANAVLLAARLDTRLLAALAWIGGYLTPILLSTGEDKLFALYLYLTLLDLGALVLDHRKPWGETVPLAMAGTLVLYVGWYERFFRPERFEAAAAGIVLFTALFALGMARKQRGIGLGIVYVLGATGFAVLAAGADRPAVLFVLSLALAAAALRSAATLGRGLALVAAVAVGLPFMAWSAAHYSPAAFGIAAAWIVGGMLLFVLAGDQGGDLAPLALAAGGIASVLFAGQTDRPVALLAFLLAQAGVAVLARRRWTGAELVGVAAAALSVLAWFDRYYRLDRAEQAYALALPVAGVYLLALVVRGLVLGQELGKAGMVSHLVNAAFLWTILYRVLYASNPSALGLASLGLAVVYLIIGIAALRERPGDLLHVRTLLGLAAGFLTVAIPVQLGLNGITLAWAVEGVVLLGLGVRFASPLARAGAYGVLALAALRLLVRHLPLHPGSFRPVLNPGFGIWLAVIASLALAAHLARGVRRAGASPDRALAPITSVLALALLFGVMTAETTAGFDQRIALAVRAGDGDAAQTARLMGWLAISLLWSGFATALLTAGLAMRSRPLFYTAYGLFALTAGKVVLADLAMLQTIYRILSFLALGVLLMAGAYLNIRFRDRLLSREAGK